MVSYKIRKFSLVLGIEMTSRKRGTTIPEFHLSNKFRNKNKKRKYQKYLSANIPYINQGLYAKVKYHKEIN